MSGCKRTTSLNFAKAAFSLSKASNLSPSLMIAATSCADMPEKNIRVLKKLIKNFILK